MIGNIQMRPGSCFVILTVILLAINLHSVAGAKDKNAVSNVKKGQSKSKVEVSQKVKDYEMRLARLLAPVEYRYSPLGKPDPFMPFFRTSVSKVRRTAKVKGRKAKRPAKCSTPLECMDVGQLTLVGVVLEPGGESLAMAQDASGIGYILKRGTRIGYNNGKVIAIYRDKVIVREEVQDIRGNMTQRDRVLYLHPEEENGSKR